MCGAGKKSQSNAGHPMRAGTKSEGFVLLLKKPVMRPYLKGCVQFWSPGGCSGVREKQLERIKGLELLPYEQQRAGMLQFVQEKAQER